MMCKDYSKIRNGWAGPIRALGETSAAHGERTSALRSAARAGAFLLVPLLLSGCQWLSDLRERILTQGEKTVTNVAEQAMKTKESVEKKIEDVKRAAEEVEEAAKEVNEAIDAVKKVTGEKAAGSANAPAPQPAPQPSPQQQPEVKKQAPSLAD